MKHNTLEAHKIEKNYTKVDNRVIRSPIFGHRHVVFRVYVILSSLPKDAFISERKIHALTGISGNAFRSAIKTLVEIGAVEIIEKGGRFSYGNRSNRYRLYPVDYWKLNRRQLKQMSKALRPFSHAARDEAVLPHKLQQGASEIEATMPQKMRTNNNDNNKINNNENNNSSSQFSNFNYFDSRYYKKFKRTQIRNKKDLKLVRRFIRTCFSILESKNYFRELPAHVDEFLRRNSNLITFELVQSVLNFKFKGEKGKDINSRLSVIIGEKFKKGGGIQKKCIQIKKTENKEHRYLNSIENDRVKT